MKELMEIIRKKQENIKVKIFTEASSAIGFGHGIRCLSLYDELIKRGAEVEYIINGDESIQKLLPNATITIMNWLEESGLLGVLEDTDYAIVDSYLAPLENYERIAEYTKRALYIDDYQRIQYPKGVILNPLSRDERFKYRDYSSEVTILSGPKYVLIRSEFLECHSSEKETSESVLLLLGGTDVLGLRARIVRFLLEFNPSWNVDVVVGNNENQEAMGVRNVTIHSQLNALEMRDLIKKSSVVISASGQTLFELLYMKKVFLPIIVIDNQETHYNALQETFPEMLGIDARDSKDPVRDIAEIFQEFLSVDYRRNFKKKTSHLIDGLGAKRGVDALLNDGKRN